MFATYESAARLLQAGDLTTAERHCKELLKRRPRDPQALHLLALAVHHGGRPGEAVKLFRKAIRGAPREPAFRFNLGECYRALGKPDAAVASYREALALAPGDAGCHAGIGEARLAQGRPAEAEASFRAAITGAPRLIAAWNGLGIALRETGRLAEAVDSWRRALELDPKRAEIHNNLGLGLRGLGRPDEAAATLVRAIELQPGNPAILRNLAACLKNRPVATVTPGLRRQLEACFEAPGIDTQTLVSAALGALESDAEVAAALTAADAGRDIAVPDALARDPLLLRLLETTFVAKPRWEALLTRMRARLLARPEAAPPELRVALALQCFNNEYVFDLDPAEAAVVETLLAGCERRLATNLRPEPALECDLARLAMYRPLHTLAGAGRLLETPETAWSAPFRRLVERQLREPLEERDLRATIPKIAERDAPSASAVRAMYEENPYPRWITTGDRSPQTAAAVLRGLFPHFRPPEALRDAARILIAGCGTGKQAIDVATRFKDCRVLAIDLSLASLGYAARMARRRGVDNIDFRQGDLRDLPVLGERFDVIECVGVLHHLAGRDEARDAWEMLAGLLRPGGVMKIGLYSEIARRHVTAARRFAAAGGYPATVEGIRRCRRAIAALPEGRIERQVMRNRDFYSTSSCRDLIFHVQEHCYTLPVIAETLTALDLDFIGFELDKPEVLNAYRAAFPDDPDMTALADWHRFEQDHPETFAGLYQFWCAPR
ncbi:MAG: tetratricopeptide repeat protein [Alphaproteobacteria bacterium]